MFVAGDDWRANLEIGKVQGVRPEESLAQSALHFWSVNVVAHMSRAAFNGAGGLLVAIASNLASAATGHARARLHNNDPSVEFSLRVIDIG